MQVSLISPADHLINLSRICNNSEIIFSYISRKYFPHCGGHYNLAKKERRKQCFGKNGFFILGSWFALLCGETYLSLRNKGSSWARRARGSPSRRRKTRT